MTDEQQRYAAMQRAQTNTEAAAWSPDSPESRNPLVGSFDAHNAWQDYELLFKGIDTTGMIALDFGTGPGRNIVRFADRFERIDGVDISSVAIEKAQGYTARHGLSPQLFVCNGHDIREIADATYDFVFSTICMQHIAMHTTRLDFFKEFFRVLKPGGRFSVQFGFGGKKQTKRVQTFGWFVDAADAPRTNGRGDVMLLDVESEILADFNAVGYVDTEWDIRPVGPGDNHKNWIFIRTKKP